MQELLLLIQHIQDFYFVFSVRDNCIITESYFIVIVAKPTYTVFSYYLLIISHLHLNPFIIVLFF